MEMENGSLTFKNALEFGRKYSFEESHGRQVCRIALSLFDQLPKLHGLGKKEREILLVAALLHDIGCAIDYSGHHKHSRDLLLKSKLPGFSKEETQAIANIARYHRKADPREKHRLFGKLSLEFREIVKKLAAFLRIADALDREHLERVKSIEAHVAQKTLILEVTAAGNPSIELAVLEKKAKLFQKVFKMSLEVKLKNEYLNA